MSLDILKLDDDVKPQEERMPSGSDGSYILDSGVYPMVVEMAYFSKSKGGALALNLTLQSEEFKTRVRQTLWVTSGDQKGNKNYYVDKDGNKRALPGMAQADELAKILTGKSLSDLSTEEKVIKLYNYDTKQEEPTKKEVLMDFLGERLIVGIVKIQDNKRVQTGDGNWIDGPDKREFNEFLKFFTDDGRTLAEKEAGETEAKYLAAWKEKHEGNTINHYKAPAPGTAPAASGGGSDDLPDLFS